MLEFSRWPEAARLSVTFFLALCVLAQALAAVLCLYRRREGGGRIAENLLEWCVLAQILVCAQMYAELMQSYQAGLIPPTGYVAWRTAVFVLLALLAAVLVAESTKTAKMRATGSPAASGSSAAIDPFGSPLPVITAAGMTLAPVEALAGRAFAYLYLAAMLCWFVRSSLTASRYYREIRLGLSAVSIKNAMDSLHTGMMFCEEDGFVLLVNTQMLRLMSILTGKEHRDGRYFYGLLTLGEIEPDCGISWLEDQNVCILPDGSAWLFGVTLLPIGRKRYFQLTATDISERWKLITALQPKDAELRKRQKELGEVIANLDILVRERETQHAKMRAHDVLGERLTLLLRTVRSEQALDYAQLRSLSHGLIDDLKAAQSIPSPQDALDGLLQAFAAVGVEILVDNSLPEDVERGRLMTDVIREAVANAVRHGFATQVYVQIEEKAGASRLRITDNGRGSPETLAEGGGIGGMRRRAEILGGRVSVAVGSSFALTLELPGVAGMAAMDLTDNEEAANHV